MIVRRSSRGRAVRPLTLRCPAPLRTGRYFHVPAFADVRLTLASPDCKELVAPLGTRYEIEVRTPPALRKRMPCV
jgi:hypothetical protein